jgi:hypothetical protein
MKKLFLFILLLIPINVFAYDIKLDEYEKKTLDQILIDIGNDKFIDTEENYQGIPIYFFYGKECGYSKQFIDFYVDQVLPKYKHKIHIVGFETWHDNKNASLYATILKYKKSDYEGSPLIIIGDRVFEGYTQSYNNQIISAIDNTIKNNNKKDIIEEMNSISDNDLDNEIKKIILIPLFIILLTVALVFIIKKK